MFLRRSTSEKCPYFGNLFSNVNFFRYSLYIDISAQKVVNLFFFFLRHDGPKVALDSFLGTERTFTPFWQA